jgi:hypothetical protein
MDKLPTINIKGKPYTLIKDRVLAFHELYPNGMIVTEMLSAADAKTIVFKASVYPDVGPLNGKFFTGHSQAEVGGTGVNATAALENAETSAVGRALGFLGIGIVEGIASADEIVKATGEIIKKSTLLPKCPKCQSEFKLVPAGVSKKSGKSYKAFYACQNSDCKSTVSVEAANDLFGEPEPPLPPDFN